MRLARSPFWLGLSLAFALVSCTDEPGPPAPSAALSAELLWNDTPKLIAANGASGNLFGWSVSIDGNTAVIGAPDDPNSTRLGSAYVFERDAAGVWSEKSQLLASDGAAGDVFGISVSISGDYVAVGASRDASPGERGSVYVFERDSAGQWSEKAKLLGGTGVGTASFGYSVSLSGNRLAVGAHGDTTKGSNAGAAYVFERNQLGTWVQSQKLFPLDPNKEDEFGWSVAISGTRLLVSAPEDFVQFAGQGSAYLFELSAGMWIEQKKLAASDGGGLDAFGWSVSLDGDTAVVGSYHDDDTAMDSGSAYVFERGGGQWSETAKLVASDPASGDNFAGSVSINGNVAAMGAAFTNANGSNSGSVYVFERDGAGQWSQVPKLLAADGDSADELGWSVAVSGNEVMAGARSDEDNGFQSGAAYVFRGSAPPGGQGVACGAGSACNSGFCVDGVCCDTACGAGDPTDCQVCSLALGGSADGTCSPLTQGTICRAAAGACDAEEQCDGVALTCPADGALADGSSCDSGNGSCLDGSCDPLGAAGTSGAAGAAGMPAAGAGGSAGAGSGGAPGNAGDSGDDASCGCRTVAEQRRAPPFLAGLALALGLVMLRRARRR